ncbi:MAG: ATP-binding cassette domain-containing protein [Caulobacteraceae bacterium]
MTAALAPVLTVAGLKKVYDGLIAVDGVSFEVAPGEIVGLVGPNGAGKTTTISMIMGVLEPSAGQVHIDGVDLSAHRAKALAHTNFATAYAPLPGNLTVEQNLKVFGLIYGVKGPEGADQPAPVRVRPDAPPHDQVRAAVVPANRPA